MRPAGLSEPAAHRRHRHCAHGTRGSKLKRVPISRIFRNQDFGYTTITVERPLRDEAGQVVVGLKGKQKARASPSPTAHCATPRTMPLAEDIQAYFEREVLPHAPDAWVDEEKSKVGHARFPSTATSGVFEPPRNLHAIDEELKAVSANIMKMLEELTE